jgi:hypothetical protein
MYSSRGMWLERDIIRAFASKNTELMCRRAAVSTLQEITKKSIKAFFFATDMWLGVVVPFHKHSCSV